MTVRDLASIRSVNQKIIGSSLAEPRDVLSWMTAMQAQDFEMAKWAVGLRLAESSRSAVEAAIDRGEILRTHLLRPTWHLVAAQDIRWILDLTAPRILASAAPRLRQLELTATTLAKSLKAIEKALSRAGQLGRKDLIAAVEKAGVKTDGQRAPHILLVGELEGLICSAACKGRETAYALLDERAPASPKLDRDDALARLAARYFSSRGPATARDFSWWSGLTLGDARRGVAAIEGELEAAEVEGKTYYTAARESPAASGNATASGDAKAARRTRPVRLLPAFDEFLIAYADRSAALANEHFGKTVSSNGIFWPTIVVDGEVVGLWSRKAKKDGITVEYELFTGQTDATMRLIEKEAEKYARFG